jgi:hypothetical protein
LAFFAQTTVSFCKNCYHNIGFREKRQLFRRKLGKIAENWEKLPKIGKNCRKLGKIAENWEKLPKIGKNCRKLGKIAENSDHNIDPCSCKPGFK